MEDYQINKKIENLGIERQRQLEKQKKGKKKEKKNKLSKTNEELLKAHKKKGFSIKHINFMRDALLQGASWKQSHTQAIKFIGT